MLRQTGARAGWVASAERTCLLAATWVGRLGAPGRQASLPPQASDFTVVVRGRPVPWLSRLLGLVLAPILSWRMRRGWRPRA